MVAMVIFLGSYLASYKVGTFPKTTQQQNELLAFNTAIKYETQVEINLNMKKNIPKLRIQYMK